MNPCISNSEQICYVRRYTLNGGNADGLKVVELYNGKLRVLLNESRALDVMQMFHGGTNLSFLSKNAFQSRPLPFIERFEGGMIYTCGLDSIGGRDGYELHGTHHITPARILECEANEQGIVVRGEVIQSALFGQNLRFVRTVTLPAGAETLTVSDEITNSAFTEAKYCLLYHTNVGYPMLDEGAKVITDTVKVTPRNEWAKVGLDGRCNVTAPAVGLEERCFFLEMNTPKAEVVNEKLGKKFVIEYSKETLPCFIQWNSFAAGDYALGLEPATAWLDEGFSYRTLPAGESVRFTLKLSAYAL